MKARTATVRAVDVRLRRVWERFVANRGGQAEAAITSPRTNHHPDYRASRIAALLGLLAAFAYALAWFSAISANDTSSPTSSTPHRRLFCQTDNAARVRDGYIS